MPEKLEGIENLKPLKFYIDYFVSIWKARQNFRCYNEDDIKQQAVITLLEVYPRFKIKLEAGRKINNIISYFGKVIYNRHINFKLANSYVVSAKSWANYASNADLFKGPLSTPVSIQDSIIAGSGTEDIISFDLHLDVKEFYQKHPYGNIIELRLQGFTLVEIARQMGLNYPALAWRNRKVCLALKKFLAKSYINM